MSLCAPCAKESARWLDYSPPPPIRIAVSGNPHHTVPWGARINDTIRTQRRLIREHCARSHQPPE